MAAVRCHIMIQSAVIGSEIKTLSTTADGAGAEKERESRLLGKWQTNIIYPSMCMCVCVHKWWGEAGLLSTSHHTDCNASVAGVHWAKVNTEMEGVVTAARSHLKDSYIFICYL